MKGRQRIQGIWVGDEEIVWLADWIRRHSGWTRKRFARELCQLWEWKDHRGQLKDLAARSFLLKLQQKGYIRLPALREQMRSQRKEVVEPEQWQKPEERKEDLNQLRPLQIEVIEAGTPNAQRWQYYLSRYHYLGFHVIGENLGYLIRDCKGQDLACLVFGAAAWRCAARDRFFGWDASRLQRELGRGVNNSRFLILPWVRVTGLASHLLGLVARRIRKDWQNKYKRRLEWVETFVQSDRFAGTCYRAANWRRVGQTAGRSRQDQNHRLQVAIKDVYIYRLRR